MSHEDIIILCPTEEFPDRRLQVAPVKVGGHVASFTLEIVGAMPVQAIKITATSDSGGRASHVMTLIAKHDRTDGHFMADLAKAAWKVAEEAAGHGQTQTLLDRFFPR